MSNCNKCYRVNDKVFKCIGCGSSRVHKIIKTILQKSISQLDVGCRLTNSILKQSKYTVGKPYRVLKGSNVNDDYRVK